MALIFKSITPIPKTAQELNDIVLSSTNRRTATVIHPNFKISRIRDFYMNKVRFAQSEYHEHLTKIIEEFPRLDSIHPFWAAIVNVIYDRDHYKLALGQIVGARSLIDSIGRDYVKYLKYGDTLFRCKQLKKAALGRMVTACRRLTPSLTYLEEVRQHLQRMPAIDPTRPTIILAGAPSTGKSTFMNAVTNANVEVAAFPFTTKYLYMGNTHFKFETWQVIDTPGLLDRSLEERNTIEMQAIMAMVHLHAAILFFVDPSESCGYTMDTQVALYNSLRDIFQSRPVTVVFSKSDIARAPLNFKKEFDGTQCVEMSCRDGENIEKVKEAVCESLRQIRLEMKRGRADKIASQLTIAKPEQTWEPNIPPEGSFTPIRSNQEVPDTNLEKLLANDEWRYDAIPEIIEGRNVADYYDANIMENFKKLAEEERVRYAEYLEEKEIMDEKRWKITDDQEEMARLIRERRALIRKRAIAHESGKQPIPLPLRKRTKTETAAKVDQMLAERGVDEETREKAVEKVMGARPKRVQRTIEPESRDKGVKRKGKGEKFDYYVKTNWVLEPKHMFSGKSGFKRDFK